jgi:hypothetical protein
VFNAVQAAGISFLGNPRWCVKVAAALSWMTTAQMPDGASEQVVRTVTENGRTLKFTNHGFETN